MEKPAAAFCTCQVLWYLPGETLHVICDYTSQTMNQGVKQNTLPFWQANVTDSSAKSLQQMTLLGIFILLELTQAIQQQFVQSLVSMTSSGRVL